MLLQAPGFSQEESFYKHYTVNPLLINPGFTGFEGHQIFLDYNSRWSKFPGAPKIVTASYNGPVANGIGLGAMITNHTAASLSKLKAQLSYAYKFKVQEDFDLSLGLATAYEQTSLRGTGIIDPSVDSEDPTLIEALGGFDVFDASFGAHAKYGSFTFGASLPNMIRARVDDNSSATKKNNEFFKYFLGYAGYRLDVKEYNFSIEPLIAVKSIRNAPFQADFNLTGRFADDKFIGSFTYTVGGGNASSLMIGTRLNPIDIYYSYTVSFLPFQSYNTGGHEVSLAFNLGNTKAKN